MPQLNTRAPSGQLPDPLQLSTPRVMIDTYARPGTQPSAATNLLQIAGALQDISPSATRLMGTLYAKQQDELKSNSQATARQLFEQGASRDQVAAVDPFGFAAEQYDSLKGEADHLRYMNRAVQAVRESTILSKENVGPNDLTDILNPIKQEIIQANKGSGPAWLESFQKGSKETDHNISYMVANSAVNNWQKGAENDLKFGVASDILNSADWPDIQQTSGPNPDGSTMKINHSEYIAQAVQNAAIERAKKIYGDTPEALRQANLTVSEQMKNTLSSVAIDPVMYTKFPQLVETWRAMKGGTGPLAQQYPEVLSSALREWHYAENARAEQDKAVLKQVQQQTQIDMIDMVSKLDPQVLQQTPSPPGQFITNAMKSGMTLDEVKSSWAAARAAGLEPKQQQADEQLKELDYILADPQGRDLSGNVWSKADAMKLVNNNRAYTSEALYRSRLDEIQKLWGVQEPEIAKGETALGSNLNAAMRPITEKANKTVLESVRRPDGSLDQNIAMALSTKVPRWETDSITGEPKLVDKFQLESPIDTHELERQAQAETTLWFRNSAQNVLATEKDPKARDKELQNLQVQAVDLGTKRYQQLLGEAAKKVLPGIDSQIKENKARQQDFQRAGQEVIDAGTPNQRLTLKGVMSLQGAIGGQLDRMNTGVQLSTPFRLASHAFSGWDQAKIEGFDDRWDSIKSGYSAWHETLPKDIEDLHSKVLPSLEAIMRAHQHDAASFVSGVDAATGKATVANGGGVGGKGVTWSNEIFGSPTAASAGIYKNAVISWMKIKQEVPATLEETLRADPALLDWRTMPLLTAKEITPQNLATVAKHLGIESKQGLEDFAKLQSALIASKSKYPFIPFNDPAVRPTDNTIVLPENK